jgi:predicted RND superfamily exporter protein
MGKVTRRIEAGFDGLARFLIRRRLAVVLVIGAALAVLFTQLPRTTFDTSTEGFFHADDPALLEYNAFRNQYGRDELIVIAVQPPDVFDIAFLGKLKAFHDALGSEVPHLDDITSLVNARLTRAEGDTLVVEDLLDELPRTDTEMGALRERVLTHPLYRNQLISEDGRFTTVVIKTNAFSTQGGDQDLLGAFGEGARAGDARTALTDEENSRVVAAVRAVAARFEAPDFRVWIAGSPVVTDLLKRAMQQDIRRFLLLAVAAIGFLLAILFRRLSGVILPLLIVLLSAFATLALMAWFGVPLKTPTSILPSFILAIGVGETVHVLAIFYRRFESTGDRDGAIVHALGHSGLPILMTSLTTAVGLLSFTTAQLAPIADLGRFAAAGELLALLLTLVLLPALLA